MEQFWGHVVSPVTREHSIMEAVFSVTSVPKLYNEGQMSLRDNSRVEAGSNTSTVTLQS
jgi:hypothetical protein